MVVDKPSWMFDGNALILVKGVYGIPLPLEAFEILKGWDQLQGFHDGFISEDTRSDLLQL